MQTQRTFARSLQESVKGLMGEEYRVEVNRTEKINVGTLHSLTIFNNESSVAPNFYIEDLYKDYQHGCTVDEIAEDIVSLYYYRISLSVNDNLGVQLNDSKWVKERLILRLVDSEKNKELLDSSIYMDFKGISLVLCIMVSNDYRGIGQARVTTKMCEDFGWDKVEILNYALENTARLLPYEETPLCEILQEVTGGMYCPDNIENPELTVLTNSLGINGAVAAFYPNALKEVARKHGTSLFLLPSSIHEFIVLEDDGIHDPKDLAEIVKEVNSLYVLPEERLSDSIYYYEYDSGILSIYEDGELTEIAVL